MAKKEKKKSRVGAFFGGFFTGFIFLIALIVGVGAFAYFVVSPKWLNDNFKANISVNKEIEAKTLNDYVKTVGNILSNFDSYTLNNLKDDFGISIEDELLGINISDLKAVPFNNLAQAVEDKLGSLSAKEVENLFNLSTTSMGKIMDKTNLYYFDGTKLYKNYKDGAYSNEVSFDYEVKDNKVVVEGDEFSIKSGTTNVVEIKLNNLPLTVAISDFISTMGDKITLGELETDYGVKLPSYFKNVDRKTTINELETEINKVYLADFLGYTLNADKTVVTQGATEIKGIMAKFAKLTVGELSTAKSVIDDTTIAEVVGYDKKADGYYLGNEKVTGVMAAVADCKVGTIANDIKQLKVKDIFKEDTEDGILSLIGDDVTIDEMPNELTNVVTTKTLKELVQANVVDKPDNYESLKTTVSTIPDTEHGGYKTVENLNLSELVQYSLDLIEQVEELKNAIT